MTHQISFSANLQKLKLVSLVYTTENFRHGSGGFDPGDQNELDRHCLHYTKFAAPKYAVPNVLARISFLWGIPSSRAKMTDKDRMVYVMMCFLASKRSKVQHSTIHTEIAKIHWQGSVSLESWSKKKKLFHVFSHYNDKKSTHQLKILDTSTQQWLASTSFTDK